MFEYKGIGGVGARQRLLQNTDVSNATSYSDQHLIAPNNNQYIILKIETKKARI